MKFKNCVCCGKEFGELSLYFKKRKYCDSTCRSKMLWSDYAKKNGHKQFSTATTGAMHEYMVCIDLIKKGFDIFRAVSPSSPFDLIAFKNDEIKKIEVRTGYRLNTGKIVYPQKTNSKIDIWAVVLHGGEILYFPENSIA